MNYDKLMDSVNRNRSKKIKHRVEGKTLLEISEETGIAIQTLYSRWDSGKRTYEELSKPIQWKRNKEERYREACDRGKRLLNEMDKKDLKVADLSRRANVSVDCIDGFLYNPNTNIQARTLLKMCYVLDCSMDYLMGKESVC